MRRALRKPRVVTSSVFSPLRSSSPLVATVLPISTHSPSSGVTASPGFRPSRWRMPATAASRYCSGFSDSSLCVTRLPSGRLATMSVKVPPRSIQNCQRDGRAGAWVVMMSRQEWLVRACRNVAAGVRGGQEGVVRNEDVAGLRAGGAHPFERELLAVAAQVLADLEVRSLDVHAMRGQLAQRGGGGGLAGGPAAILGIVRRQQHRPARRLRNGL